MAWRNLAVGLLFDFTFCKIYKRSIISHFIRWQHNKNDVMRLGERPRSLEGKPNITGTDRERQTGTYREGLTDRERRTGTDGQGETDRD